VAPAALTMGYLMSPDDLRLIEGADADFDRVTETWVTDPLNTRTATGALGIDWSMIDLTTDGTSRWIREAPDVPDARLRRLTIASTALGEPIGVTSWRDSSGVLRPTLFWSALDQSHSSVRSRTS
jgi:hypothetical protein